MPRIGLAFKAFFRVLRDEPFAQGVAGLLAGRTLAAGPAVGAPPAGAVTVRVPPKPEPPRAMRNDAVSLLALLQREGRLVDFLQEDIAAYSDAQVGAAVRDVHRDCAAAISRVFSLKRVMQEAEGAAVEVPAGFDAARTRLVGNVAGQGPFRGVLQHAGWEVAKVELPEWTGGEGAVRVVAPAEVEVK